MGAGYMNKWEKVSEAETSHSDLIQRIEVDGGYLYRNTVLIAGSYHVTMTFVPFAVRDSRIEDDVDDPDHECPMKTLITHCESEFKNLHTECRRLSKYISDCDKARFDTDEQLREQIEIIRAHLVL